MRRRKPWWIKTIHDVPQDNIISLKSEEGQIGEDWWAKAWVSVLEDSGEKGRLSRARTCARTGSGSRLRIKPGEMSIGICCSEYTIRDVTFWFPKYKEHVWERLIAIVAADAALTGSLLSGDFSEYFAEELREEKIFLLPRTIQDITTLCYCSDGHDPCIHIAVAWYLFAEVLDANPWHLLTLHGIPKDEVISRVRKLREIEEANLSKPIIPKERLSGNKIDLPKNENPTGFFSMTGDLVSLQSLSDHDTGVNPLVLLGPAPAKLGSKNLSDRVGSLYPKIRDYAEYLMREKR
jgi:uncharacterized Zn finger protein